MSQSIFEPQVETADEAQDERAEPAVEAAALSVSAIDFSALEERVLRAVELLKKERQARAAAEQHAAQAETQLREQTALTEQLQAESGALKAERDQVRLRVERLLAQLDALEL